MSPRQAAPPRPYTTGFCLVSGRHDLCHGTFRGTFNRVVTCSCRCHEPPPPPPEPARCPTCGQTLPEVTDAR